MFTSRKHAMERSEKSSKRSSAGNGRTLLTLVGLATAAYFLYEPATQWLHRRKRQIGQRVRSAVDRAVRQAVGASVQWDDLTISPLRGLYEARGVRVIADGADQPVMQIDRVQVELLPRRMLAGEVRITRAVVERPVFSIIHRADGQTNLPALARDTGDAIHKARQAADVTKTAVEAAQRVGRRWGLAVRLDQAQIVGGEFHYRDETLGEYGIRAEPIDCRLWREAGGYRYEADIGAIARRDGQGRVGPVVEQGELTGTDNLLQFIDMGLRSETRFAEDARMQTRIDRLSSGDWQFHTEGAAALDKVGQLLPEQLPGLEALRGVQARGEATAQLRFEYVRGHGLRIAQANVQARDLEIGR